MKALRHAASLVTLLILGLLAVGTVDTHSDTSKQPQSSSTSERSAASGEMRINGDQWFGCESREAFEKLAEIAAQGDDVALKNDLAAGVASDECTLFKNGEPVYIADAAMTSGLVKLRRKGNTREFWTHTEAAR